MEASTNKSLSIERVVEDLNHAPIPQEKFLSFAQKIDLLDKEDRVIENFAKVAARLFNEDPQMVSSAMFRMAALAWLIQQGKVQGWTGAEQQDGSVQVRKNIFAAAAQAKLYVREGQVEFDENELLKFTFELGKDF